MKNKTSIIAVTKAFFILLVIGSLFSSCIDSSNKTNGWHPNGLPRFKYKVTYGFGNTTIHDYTTGDIIYMAGGQIKFESYNNGHTDTVIVGGTYLIENYR